MVNKTKKVKCIQSYALDSDTLKNTLPEAKPPSLQMKDKRFITINPSVVFGSVGPIFSVYQKKKL